jgi:glycosyltransferase involved in cell wall biosynthesis
MSARVLVSTPDLRPSLLSVLQGLAETGLLERVVTTLSFDAHRLQQIASIPLLGSRLASALQRRRAPAFLQGKTDTIWLGEFVRLIAAKSVGPIATHRVWDWAERRFDRLVARTYGGRFDLIYGVENGSASTFAAQKAAGGTCVLRQVTAHGRTLNAVLKRECERFPQFVTPYHRLLLLEDERVITRKEEEYRLADLILANSDYVRRTFIEHGVSPEKVVGVPTGCPPVERLRARSGRGNEPLRFLYAGTVSLRKGFPYLLQAWREAKLGSTAELWIAGGMELDILPEIERASGVRYLGALSKSELKRVYCQSDILVLPTLCEGLAHVLLESLSFGLPAITTEASGAGNLIVHGENGLLVAAADSAALAASLLEAVARRRELPQFGERSAERAAAWTVADSNAQHVQVLQSFLKERV